MNGLKRVKVMAVTAMLAVGVLSAGSVQGVRIGDDEGCTPGFWKNNPAAWQEYSPSDRLDSVFTIPAAFSELADDTLLQALNYGGGPGALAKAQILLKAAVAAVLNAASEDVGYPYRRHDAPLGIIPSVNSALAGGNETTMEDLKDVLDDANNLGCPLDADEAAK
jgi:hypothetical protein